MTSLVVLSLGAGVQSSCLYLMAADGEFGEVPDAAVFADTQWEPRAVYEHLDRLERLGGDRIPIRRVTAGDLREAALTTRVNPSSGRRSRVVSLPLYVRNPNGTGGTLHRQCTRDFKVRPIRRAVRALLLERGLAASPDAVEQWIGISLDEVTRMKESGVRFINNRFPLVDRRMTRSDCERQLWDRWQLIAPKSACISCPYTNDERRRDRRKNDPDSWAQDVAFDLAVRRLPEVNGECFVHPSLVPLSEVDFRSHSELGQTDLFLSECEGMCGV